MTDKRQSEINEYKKMPNKDARGGDSNIPIKQYYNASKAVFSGRKARLEGDVYSSADKNIFSGEAITEDFINSIRRYHGIDAELDDKTQRNLVDVNEPIYSDTLQQFQTFQPFPDAYDESSKISYSNNETDKDKYVNTKDSLESNKLSPSPDKSIDQEKPVNFDEKLDRQTWTTTKSEEDLLLALMESTPPQSEKSLLGPSPDKSITQEKPVNFDEKLDRQTWTATKSEEDLLLALMESTPPQSEKSLLEDPKQPEDIGDLQKFLYFDTTKEVVKKNNEGLQPFINTETMAEEKKISKQDQKDSISKSPDQSKNLDKTLLEQLTKTLQYIHADTEPKYILRPSETEKVRESASRLKKAYQTEQAIRSALDEELQLQLSESPEDSDIRKDALVMTKNKKKQKEMLKTVREHLDEMKDKKPSLLETRRNVKIVLHYCEKTNISLEKQKFLLKLDKWINHENFDPKNLNQAVQRMRAIINKLCEENIWDHLDRGGGKAELAEAKIICLGEHHEAPIHRIYQKAIFNSLAKDGDIVLLEGIESSQSAPKISAEKHIGQLTKSIKIFGWDNMDAHTAQGQITMTVMKNKAFSPGHEALHDWMGLVRDKKLKETISNMRQDHPDKKIFVIGGINHFTRYAKNLSEENLKEVIILIPTNEPSKEESYKRRAKKYLVNNSSITDKNE